MGSGQTGDKIQGLLVLLEGIFDPVELVVIVSHFIDGVGAKSYRFAA